MTDNNAVARGHEEAGEHQLAAIARLDPAGTRRVLMYLSGYAPDAVERALFRLGEVDRMAEVDDAVHAHTFERAERGDLSAEGF